MDFEIFFKTSRGFFPLIPCQVDLRHSS